MTGRSPPVSAPTAPVDAGSLARLPHRLSLSALPGGMRARVLVWFVVLLVFSSVVTFVGLRENLTAHLATDIDFVLAEETEELRILAGGRNPATGQPFDGDAASIFDTFFQGDIPDESEAFYSIVDGRPYRQTVAPVSLFEDASVLAAWQTATAPVSGRTETAAGPVRWRAVPVGAGGRAAGVFAVAVYEATPNGQIGRTTGLMLGVSALSILLALVLAWAAAGHAIAPLRTLTAAAREIGGNELGKRIPVEGTDEVAQLTATLNSMLERLDAAFRSQREFLDDVSHELRTPLTIARGHLELLEDDPVERGQTVRVVLHQLDRMNRYVSELLLLARAQRPDFLHRGPLELGEFVGSLPALVGPLGDRDWRFVPVRPAIIYADADRLTQAILNLATNAVRHTEPGGVIELGASVEDMHARLWVRDEGTGIAAEEQQRIFRRFVRGRDPLTNVSEGTGLGLAIVQAIAVAHGGRTDLESAIGVGSTFSLVIPIEPPPTGVAS